MQTTIFRPSDFAIRNSSIILPRENGRPNFKVAVRHAEKLLLARRFQACLFDIDGILVDSDEQARQNAIMVLKEFSCPVPADSALLKNAGRGYRKRELLLKLIPSLASEPSKLQEIVERWRVISRTNFDFVKPTIITEDLLPLFKRQGIKLGVVTNRRAISAGNILSNLGIKAEFLVVATEEDAPSKPKPDILLYALEKMRIHPSDALLIGDLVHDYLAGTRAGVPTIWVQWGKVRNMATQL